MSANLTGAAVAEQRGALLRSLAETPERQELRAAGVAERTIDIICPVSFEEIMPGLRAVLTDDEYLGRVGGYLGWRFIGELIAKLQRGQLGKPYNWAARFEFDAFCNTEAYSSLLRHLFEHLQGPQHWGRATTLIHALWLVNLLTTEPRFREELAHECTLLFDWALPHFAEQARNLHLRAVVPTV